MAQLSKIVVIAGEYSEKINTRKYADFTPKKIISKSCFLIFFNCANIFFIHAENIFNIKFRKFPMIDRKQFLYCVFPYAYLRNSQ